MQKDSKAVKTFIEDVNQHLAGTTDPTLLKWYKFTIKYFRINVLRKAEIGSILANIAGYTITSKTQAEFGARDFAFTLGRVYAAALLIAQANWSKKSDDVHTVDIWCSMKPLSYLQLVPNTTERQNAVKALAKL